MSLRFSMVPRRQSTVDRTGWKQIPGQRLPLRPLRVGYLRPPSIQRGHRIGRAQGLRQPAGKGSQQRITGRVAVPVPA